MFKVGHKYSIGFENIQKINLAPVDIYLFKVNNGNSRAISEICLKLTVTIPEQR